MQVLIEFITETGKKRKLSAFWGWEVQTRKITTTIFILTYKRVTWYIHTKLIILNQSDTEGAENLTCRESPSSYTA